MSQPNRSEETREEGDLTRREFVRWSSAAALASVLTHSDLQAAEPAFGKDFPNLESLTTGEWWKKSPKKGPAAPPPMDVPRDQVLAFALYTVESGVLKLTAQLYPLKPGETRIVRLEFQTDGQWREAAKAEVAYPGWDAHFRIEKWDASRSVPYRLKHGEAASFEGLIRRDPIDKETLVVASMSCNSSRTTGLRPEILANLLAQDPDLLFFAGDQTYRHTEHTAGWIEFGLQFRDLIKDRPTITIPDDHDVGHPNLWGENGKRSLRNDGADGGYFYPADYVNQVQRQQTWHLPDAVDPRPIEQGITVYFTRLRLGGIDFAILEDRKFKTGPLGKIPKMGPRPDHINDPSYDPATVDVPGLQLLGERQHRFLNQWIQDWEKVELKVVLSQTAFCGAVHMHGSRNGRLLADLDCNGWPQTGRRKALEYLQRARAFHLCGDQHLAVVVKQGVQGTSDGPYAFTSPALVNTIYGRWWHPLEEKAGPNPVPGSPLPWTGEYRDGLGNPFRMLAYANPQNVMNERQRADGYGLARIHRKTREVTFECWPRFSDTAQPKSQFPGWPVRVKIDENDSREPVAWLPKLEILGCDRPVLQVIAEATGEVVSCFRLASNQYQPPVFAPGRYTISIGRDRPGQVQIKGLVASPRDQAGSKQIKL